MTPHFSLTFLLTSLIILIFVCAFFSSSETSMMAINRYRLRHLAQDKQHRGAKRVQHLLQRTDRLLTVILLGNTLANILASAVATLLGSYLYGAEGVVIATISLTIVLLIFGEIAPKTLAARYPEIFAFYLSWPLRLILILLYPFVWLGNMFVKVLLIPFHINISHHVNETINREELKNLVAESATTLDQKHQSMLISILDLENITAEDIMVPKADIIGIDIDSDWPIIMNQITHSQHTHLPLYENSLNKLLGVIHVRDVLHLLAEKKLSKENLTTIAHEPYFVPEMTPLNKQLLNFQRQKNRLAFVVDEYGSIQGLLALEDILEEIVGKFTSDVSDTTEISFAPQADGSVIVDGSLSLREINRELHWKLPIESAKTLNGLIIDIYDGIPIAQSCVRLDNYGIEILQVRDNVVKHAKLIQLGAVEH